MYDIFSLRASAKLNVEETAFAVRLYENLAYIASRYIGWLLPGLEMLVPL